MPGISGTLTATVVSMLTSPTSGIDVRVGAIDSAAPGLSVPGIRAVLPLNASVDVSEKAGHAQYPVVLVYCDKMSNTLKEKFRHFSGEAHMVIEVRHSQDHLHGIEENLEIYVDAVCALLDDSRGDWGSGSVYGGGYDVSYESATRGGKNVLQRAKVGFDVEVSK